MAARKKTLRGAPGRRQCGTMAAHMLLLETYPTFRDHQSRLEEGYAKRRSRQPPALPPARKTIKVVVNVVHHAPEQDLSLAQVRSQIRVLNRDFAGRNSDRARVPEPWKGLVSDTGLRFELAKVTRTHTDRESFTHDDAVKHTGSGGIAPHRPDTHLNLWVCALGSGLLGYAQFPGGPPATDGVVVDYRAFGTSGTAQAPFDLGRTTTHEVGHYFNLRHIWGDTEDCSGSDLVADTPNAAGPNYGAPAFPRVSCNNGPHGDMFVNYMDYVDDAAMLMFTSQQVLRMRAALAGARANL